MSFSEEEQKKKTPDFSTTRIEHQDKLVLIQIVSPNILVRPVNCNVSCMARFKYICKVQIIFIVCYSYQRVGYLVHLRNSDTGFYHLTDSVIT